MTWIGSEGGWFVRLTLQRGLALILLIAFLNAANQFKALLGERGLLPVPQFIKQVSFSDSPSLFFFLPHDLAFTIGAWLGIVLSCAALIGLSEQFAPWLSMAVWAALWVLYLSFVNVGQDFYGFGWESILLEACFYAIFLGAKNIHPPAAVIWIFRWLLFRVMFGAGLIKLRGDPCWRQLTCLDYHYETQPMPNPMSWYLHWSPQWTHRGGVLFNHFAELLVPFAYFLPQPISSIAGIITILFQASIFISGNLSWLNALTMILALSTIDDRWFAAILRIHRPGTLSSPLAFKIAAGALAILVAILSIQPIRNLLSPAQIMNTTYNPFHLVGTYGAFGSVTAERNEVIVEGSDDSALTPNTQWREYEFKGKPGSPGRMPPQIAPYHLRLDWMMWFAAMSSYRDNPWFVHFVGKLLEGDRDMLALLKINPFPDHPPRFVRASLYRYQFTSPEERSKTGFWWKRQLISDYFPAVSLQAGDFRDLLQRQGWLDREYSH